MDFLPYLEEEYRLHPLDEKEDFLKWAYQVSFGAEHLVSDFGEAERYFHEEYEATKPSLSLALAEPISPNLLRINIAAYKAKGFPEEGLFELFLRSASLAQPHPDEFEDLVSLVSSFLKEKKGQSAQEEFDRFMISYWQEGIHPLHHSEAYTKAYSPHYRLVDQEEFAAFLAEL